MERLHKKYNFYFWEPKIRDTDNIFLGNIDGKKLTRDSVIIYIGVLDSPKMLLRFGWSSHCDVNAALGFLQHVFLPTVFYNWVDRDSDEFYFSLLPFYELKTELIASFAEAEKPFNHDDILRMENEYQVLDSLWDADDNQKKDQLQAFCNQFNETWNAEPERKLFVKVFAECSKIANFILENSCDEFVEVTEEIIGMSAEQLRFMCEQVYDQPLLNKNFISLLNNKIPIWF